MVDRRKDEVNGWGGNCGGKMLVSHNLDVVVREKLMLVMDVELLSVPLHGGWNGDEDMRVDDASPREVG